MFSRIRSAAMPCAVLAMMFLVWPFVRHALDLGVAGLRDGDATGSRLYVPGADVPNIAIFVHMASGAVLTLLVGLQLWEGIRRHRMRLHRLNGYVMFTCAMLTGAGGLAYIALQGTIGGLWMDVGFALYGLLMIGVAVQTVRRAQQHRIVAHRRWALRLFVLAMGSWLYRVHYGLWYALTGGVASNDAFTGAFDLVQNFAFYLPYLLLLELWFRWRPVQREMSVQTSL
ncbi:DUF2306 domain-containing protein [uncultured Roseobacter sp.]|uniref:DUF2306 domain-containing protein n=1 Tax=uncultured Roseobacter sp. TaxID=114847 RepID=UPI00260A5760|nr:DUF2306 domain-containing protein [uncultured Roseobacter sp.]